MKEEYATARLYCTAIGVEKALQVEHHRPKGDGWRLVGSAVEGNQVFYWWARTILETKPPKDEDALAAYIFEWLGRRNGEELAPALDEMRVKDVALAKAELALILKHQGKPPNWEK